MLRNCVFTAPNCAKSVGSGKVTVVLFCDVEIKTSSPDRRPVVRCSVDISCRYIKLFDFVRLLDRCGNCIL